MSEALGEKHFQRILPGLQNELGFAGSISKVPADVANEETRRVTQVGKRQIRYYIRTYSEQWSPQTETLPAEEQEDQGNFTILRRADFSPASIGYQLFPQELEGRKRSSYLLSRPAIHMLRRIHPRTREIITAHLTQASQLPPEQQTIESLLYIQKGEIDQLPKRAQERFKERISEYFEEVASINPYINLLQAIYRTSLRRHTLLTVEMEEELQTTLNGLVANLTERERKVIEFRFGLTGQKPLTSLETGKEFGTTRERIRQIEVRALRKLRQSPRIHKLSPYIEAIKAVELQETESQEHIWTPIETVPLSAEMFAEDSIGRKLFPVSLHSKQRPTQFLEWPVERGAIMGVYQGKTKDQDVFRLRRIFSTARIKSALASAGIDPKINTLHELLNIKTSILEKLDRRDKEKIEIRIMWLFNYLNTGPAAYLFSAATKSNPFLLGKTEKSDSLCWEAIAKELTGRGNSNFRHSRMLAFYLSLRFGVRTGLPVPKDEAANMAGFTRTTPQNIERRALTWLSTNLTERGINERSFQPLPKDSLANKAFNAEYPYELYRIFGNRLNIPIRHLKLSVRAKAIIFGMGLGTNVPLMDVLIYKHDSPLSEFTRRILTEDLRPLVINSQKDKKQ